MVYTLPPAAGHRASRLAAVYSALAAVPVFTSLEGLSVMVGLIAAFAALVVVDRSASLLTSTSPLAGGPRAELPA